MALGENGGDLADMLSEFRIVVLGNPLLDLGGTVDCCGAGVKGLVGWRTVASSGYCT